jgi:hypothetical protein
VSLKYFKFFLQIPSSYPGYFLLWRKDPGRHWSRDLLKSSRFLINYLGFLYDNHTKSKLKIKLKIIQISNIYWIPQLGLLIENLLDFSRSRDQRLPGSFLPWPRGKTLGTRLGKSLLKSEQNNVICLWYVILLVISCDFSAGVRDINQWNLSLLSLIRSQILISIGNHAMASTIRD